MKITIAPLREPSQEIDITRCLVESIAGELWRRYGGNATLNWVEAEAHLRGILADAQNEAVGALRASLHNGAALASAQPANGIRKESVAARVQRARNTKKATLDRAAPRLSPARRDDGPSRSRSDLLITVGSSG